ncbi:MAG TPA: hypothetical protein ENN69_06815 [Spirochaetia bacterium]|nr:hypothetical protein [Spirochaetia bacterium]
MKKQLHTTILATLAAVALTLAACASADKKITIPEVEKELNAAYLFHQDWQEMTFEDFIVSNNVWGKKDTTNYVQYIYRQSEESEFPFGWGWYWPKEDGRVKAYPEIIYGFKPWASRSTNDALPIRVNNIGDITVAYDITSTATHDYNLSFDIWVTKEQRPTPQNITHEVMIWLDQKDLLPVGELVETVTLGGEEYDFYAGNVSQGTWQYLAFVKKTPEYKGDTKINLFFDYLVKKNYVKPEQYLASIEFGNEVVAGSARTTFQNYQVSVN